MISNGILTEKLINSSKLINSLKEVSKVLSTGLSSRLIWVKSIGVGLPNIWVSAMVLLKKKIVLHPIS